MTRKLRAAVAALVLLAIASALRLLPFRRAIKLGSVKLGKRSKRSNASEWVHAVRSASRRAPWRTVCIHEALAVQWLLRRRGIPAILVYGASSAARLEAHVWVKVGNKTLVGAEEESRFQAIARFPVS